MTLTARPKQPASHKKRNGHHHKHSGHYVKTYWPYLPMVLIVLTGVLLTNLWQPKAAVLGTNSDFTQQTLLSATNAERDKHHEADLVLDQQLSQAASAKARDMVTRNYWSHTTPSGAAPWIFITATGYDYAKAAENLAAGFSSGDAAVSGWMNSPEHRANMLDATFTEVGFGIATSENFVGKGPETVIVAYYAEPVSADAATRASTRDLSNTTQNVSRIQVMTEGSASWSMTVCLLILLISSSVFAYRHLRLVHRAVARSEHFVLAHPFWDTTIITLATAAYMLTRLIGTVL